jgi:hypothetical protein
MDLYDQHDAIKQQIIYNILKKAQKSNISRTETLNLKVAETELFSKSIEIQADLTLRELK